MTRIIATLLVLLATFLNAPTAHASTIVYFDTYRSLMVNGQLFESTDTGSFNASTPGGTGSAEHRSTISQSGITALGNIAILSNTSGSPGAHKSTQLFTSFQIDAPYSASLDFRLLANDSAYSEGFFYDQNTQTKLAEVMLFGGGVETGALRFEGVLEPGVYSLFLFSEVSASAGPYFGHGTIGGDLALTPFTPVPEPATLTLFGIGLAASAWRRRRK